MQYQFYDLGNVERGKIVEVTLGYAANVRIMDSSNYSSFKMDVDITMLVDMLSTHHIKLHYRIMLIGM